MESLFCPVSETWSDTDPSQTSSRFCLADERNWNKTEGQDVDNMRRDQAHKEIQRHPFPFEADKSGAKFTENSNFSCLNQRAREPSLHALASGMRRHAVDDCVTELETSKRPRLLHADQGHRVILIPRMRDTKTLNTSGETQRLFPTRKAEIVKLINLRRMQERQGNNQTAYPMQYMNLTSSALTSYPKSVIHRGHVHVVPKQALYRVPYEEETSPSPSLRSIPGINFVLDCDAPCSRDWRRKFSRRFNTAGGYALDHHSLPRILAVHSVSEPQVYIPAGVSALPTSAGVSAVPIPARVSGVPTPARLSAVPIPAGVSGVPNPARVSAVPIPARVSAVPTALQYLERTCQGESIAEQEITKRTELEARNRQGYQNPRPRTLDSGGLAQCDYTGAVMYGTKEISGSAGSTTTAVASEESNYEVIDLTNCDESTEISDDVLSEYCSAELVDNRVQVREFSDRKYDHHSGNSDRKCDMHPENSMEKSHHIVSYDQKCDHSGNSDRKCDHPENSEEKSNHVVNCDQKRDQFGNSERKCDNSRESDQKFDYLGNSERKSNHCGMFDRKFDNGRQCVRKYEHPVISERKCDHLRESDRKCDHLRESNGKCDHPRNGKPERNVGGSSPYLPIVGKSEIVTEGDDAKRQPASNPRRNSEPCASTSPPKLTKTIPEIIDKLIETRERMKLETIDWKKKVLFRLEKVLMKKLRRVESKTGENYQIEGLREEQTETENGNNGKKKKGMSPARRRSRQQSAKHTESLVAGEQGTEKDRSVQNPNNEKEESLLMRPGQQNTSSDGEESKERSDEVKSREAAMRDKNAGLEWNKDRIIKVEVEERMEVEETPRAGEKLEEASSRSASIEDGVTKEGAQESKFCCNFESVRRNEHLDVKYERYPEHCSAKLNKKLSSHNGDKPVKTTKGDDKQDDVVADDEKGNYPLPKNEKRIVESLSKPFNNSKDSQRGSGVMSPKATSTVSHSSVPLSCTVTGKNQTRNNINSINMISCEGKTLAVSKRSAEKNENCVRNLWTALEKNGILIGRKI